jgi:hypothetical protein
MRKYLDLTVDEIRELDRQDPDTKKDGGFQSFVVRLQKKVNHATGQIRLEDDDLHDIPRYAFDYTQGGWEDRLLKIFGRALGPRLGRDD